MLGEHGEEAASEGRRGTTYPPKERGGHLRGGGGRSKVKSSKSAQITDKTPLNKRSLGIKCIPKLFSRIESKGKMNKLSIEMEKMYKMGFKIGIFLYCYMELHALCYFYKYYFWCLFIVYS